MPSFSFGKSPKVHARTASSANLSRSSEKRSFSIPANIILLVIIALILCCGLITLYAVTRTETEYSITRQLVGVAIGIVIMVAVWFFDYRRLANLIVPLIVLDAILILLPMVPGLGHEVNGATSWIRIGSLTFQPSELAKPVTILAIGAATAQYQGSIVRGADFLKLLGILLIPFVLLMREDLGTALVILIVGFCILLIGGVARRWLIISVATAVVGVAALLGINGVVNDWTGGDVQLIRQYQMSRLLVFIDPDNPEYADDAYNLNQAKIAVGSGELVGKGWGNATQSSGRLLARIRDRLHLLRLRRAVWLRGGVHIACVVSGAALDGAGHRAFVVGFVRLAHRSWYHGDVVVPDCREHRHGLGTHAHYGHSVAVHELRFLVHVHQLHLRRLALIGLVKTQ